MVSEVTPPEDSAVGTARLNLCLGECVRERAKAKQRQKDVG